MRGPRAANFMEKIIVCMLTVRWHFEGQQQQQQEPHPFFSTRGVAQFMLTRTQTHTRLRHAVRNCKQIWEGKEKRREEMEEGGITSL